MFMAPDRYVHLWLQLLLHVIKPMNKKKNIIIKIIYLYFLDNDDIAEILLRKIIKDNDKTKLELGLNASNKTKSNCARRRGDILVSESG